MNLGQMLPMLSNMFSNKNSSNFNQNQREQNTYQSAIQNCYPNTFLDNKKLEENATFPSKLNKNFSQKNYNQNENSCAQNYCNQNENLCAHNLNQSNNSSQQNNQNFGENMFQNIFQNLMSNGSNPFGELLNANGGLGNLMGIFNQKSGENGASTLSSLFGGNQKSEIKNKNSLKKISEFKKVDEVNLDEKN